MVEVLALFAKHFKSDVHTIRYVIVKIHQRFIKLETSAIGTAGILVFYQHFNIGVDAEVVRYLITVVWAEAITITANIVVAAGGTVLLIAGFTQVDPFQHKPVFIYTFRPRRANFHFDHAKIDFMLAVIA
ncbi:hypothetical protein D3C80_1568080 [compost metagenome]